MADQGDKHLSSTDWSSKDSQADKEHNMRPTTADSINHHEQVNPLPASETQQTEKGNEAPESIELLKTSSTLQNTRGRLGLHPIAPIVQEHDIADHSDLWWPKVRLSMKEPFAEFWGTFFLVLFGDGSVAQVLLSTGEKSAPGGDGFGQYQSINWGWGLGVMLGIYIAGDSGAYLK